MWENLLQLAMEDVGLVLNLHVSVSHTAHVVILHVFHNMAHAVMLHVSHTAHVVILHVFHNIALVVILHVSQINVSKHVHVCVCVCADE